MNENTITVEAIVNAPIEKVWKYWNSPEHIKQWAFASDDWHAPSVENDLQTGGKFKTRMEAKDGSEGFDFTGTYTQVIDHELIEYTMDDGRQVSISFTPTENGTKVTETFDPEDANPLEVQRSGWQAIMDNFKKHTQSN